MGAVPISADWTNALLRAERLGWAGRVSALTPLINQKLMRTRFAVEGSQGYVYRVVVDVLMLPDGWQHHDALQLSGGASLAGLLAWGRCAGPYGLPTNGESL